MDLEIRHKQLMRLFNFTMWLLIAYVSLRFIFFFLKITDWYEWFSSTVFFIAESFALLQAYYFLFDGHQALKDRTPIPVLKYDIELKKYPAVAVVICSYKEPLDVLEQELICLHNLVYPNVQLYLLDDSPYSKPWTSEEEVAKYRNTVDTLCKKYGINLFRHIWRGAKAGMLNDFLSYHLGRPKEGSTCIYYQKYFHQEEIKYIAVLDVDQNPIPSFLENLVGFMEEHPEQAFLQSPQFYTNIRNPIGNITGMQHIIFFECICRGKGRTHTVFSVGSNILYRMSALESIGLFDDTCVTEDIATSFNLQKKGWKTAYLHKVLCFGEGPADLKSFFSQQSRWANGTIDIGLRVITAFFRERKCMPLIYWFEYFMSGTIYVYNAVFFVLFYAPCAYIFFNIQSYFFYNFFFVTIYLMFFPTFFTCYYEYLRLRKYRVFDSTIPMVLFPISSPMSFASTIRGLMGYQSAFVVTGKGKSKQDPYTLLELWPQVSALMLCIASVVWGYLRWMHHEEMTFLAFLMNCIWMAIFFTLISPVIYYNTSHLKGGSL